MHNRYIVIVGLTLIIITMNCNAFNDAYLIKEYKGVILVSATKEDVTIIISGLYDSDDNVRASIAWALKILGPDAIEAIPDLIIALGDNNGFVRDMASQALGKMGSKPVSALIAALGSKNKYKREAAIFALRDIGAEAAPALPKLKEIATSDPAMFKDIYILRESAKKAIVAIELALSKTEWSD